jgi:hypothetical protein
MPWTRLTQLHVYVCTIEWINPVVCLCLYHARINPAVCLCLYHATINPAVCLCVYHSPWYSHKHTAGLIVAWYTHKHTAGLIRGLVQTQTYSCVNPISQINPAVCLCLYHGADLPSCMFMYVPWSGLTQLYVCVYTMPRINPAVCLCLYHAD